MIRLAGYTARGFDRGASRLKESMWILVRALFFLTPLPWPSALRSALLRAFGATVGNGVVIRANVNISFPWRISIGDDVWLGEEAMILSLAQVTIESNVCVSQRAFLCTGSHDHSKETFDLITKPITLREGSWVAAMAFVGPGVEIGRGSRVAAGAVVSREVPPFVVVQGNPAAVVKELSGKTTPPDTEQPQSASANDHVTPKKEQQSGRSVASMIVIAICSIGAATILLFCGTCLGAMIERVFCERAVNGAARFSDLVLSDATNGLDVMNRPENYYLQTGAAGLGRSAVYFYFGFFRKKLLIVSFDERGHSKISLRAKSD